MAYRDPNRFMSSEFGIEAAQEDTYSCRQTVTCVTAPLSREGFKDLQLFLRYSWSVASSSELSHTLLSPPPGTQSLNSLQSQCQMPRLHRASASQVGCQSSHEPHQDTALALQLLLSREALLGTDGVRQLPQTQRHFNLALPAATHCWQLQQGGWKTEQNISCPAAVFNYHSNG